jgi:hypothetical protein
MIMKHSYGSSEVSVLHFCLSNVKCSAIFVYGNLLTLFGLCCKGVLYTQNITHIIALFLQVFQDFVYYIVSCILLTSLHTVVFFYYRIFQTVFSEQWISKYVRLMSIKISISSFLDRLCGLVVRVPGYRSRGLGFDSWRYQIFWEVLGLEQGPLSLVRIIEELPEWKNSRSSLENRY